MGAIEIFEIDTELPAETIAVWRRCIRTSSNFRACLQTPEWFSYRWRDAPNRYLAILRGNDREILAVTPLVRNGFDLRISFPKLSLGAIHLQGILINGNVPLFPERDIHYQGLLDAMLAMPRVDCISMLGVPQVGAFADFLNRASRLTRGGVLYLPDRTQKYFYIDMAGSFSEYLEKFGGKTLKKIRYRIRALEKEAEGKIELVKVVDIDQVDCFLSEAASIAANSWQKKLVDVDVGLNAPRKEVLEGFAKEGCLRCYLLKSGERTLAFAICLQVSDVCYFHETAYDPTWSRFSPGQCLLYLIIKDCFENERPSIFHFGTGEADYKAMFSNRAGEESTVLVLKANLRNRLIIRTHQLSRSFASLSKTFFSLLTRRS